MSVDSNAASSYFSHVDDCSSKYVSILSAEKYIGSLLNNVADLWNCPLFFPGDGEFYFGVFLLPERVE